MHEPTNSEITDAYDKALETIEEIKESFDSSSQEGRLVVAVSEAAEIIAAELKRISFELLDNPGTKPPAQIITEPVMRSFEILIKTLDHLRSVAALRKKKQNGNG